MIHATLKKWPIYERKQLNLANASEISRHFSREKLTATEEVGKPREITRLIDKQTSRITFNVSEELMEKLQKVKEICGKYKYEEMLEKICDNYIETHKRKIKKEGKVKSTKGRTISAETKHRLQQRSGGRCEWRHSVTGERCKCKTNSEIDHKIPHAKGGSNDLNNLRLYCKAHNQREAIKDFGQNKMDKFINKGKITSSGRSKQTKMDWF